MKAHCAVSGFMARISGVRGTISCRQSSFDLYLSNIEFDFVRRLCCVLWRDPLRRRGFDRRTFCKGRGVLSVCASPHRKKTLGGVPSECYFSAKAKNENGLQTSWNRFTGRNSAAGCCHTRSIARPRVAHPGGFRQAVTKTVHERSSHALRVDAFSAILR